MNNKKLNLESFNDILFGALNDQSPKAKKELLLAEIKTANAILNKNIYDLLDELDERHYESEQFTRIHNIKSNIEILMKQYEEL